jgi:pyruvate dehydrogenase E2 component (dihydrolipoamide acetyltransferase)
MPDVLMPRLSDTMEEGILSQWLKAEGDAVRKGDILAEIETDKATMELEAYDDGVLERQLVANGATVEVGKPIAVIGSGTDRSTGAAESTPTAEPSAPPAPPTPERAAAPAETPPERPATADDGARLRTSPLARRTARQHGIDLSTITGTGPGGRIVRADVEAAAAPKPAPPPTPTPTPTRAVRPSAAAAVATVDDEEVPLTAVRRVTARRLTESAATPHFYLTTVVDAGRLLTFRAEVNEQLAAAGIKVSVTDLLARACAVTLRRHPQANSSWAGDKILLHHRIHVGIAVALDDGLIVPVVRDADRKALSEIATEARALAERARAGRLSPDEFTGGTFTISNLGMYGIDHFTAIINPPEAAILAVGAATEEPVLRDGQLASRTTMKLTLSVDHRVLDGASGATFLRDLKDTLETPLRIVT